MRRTQVSDAELVALVEDGGATWRHTALVAAITHTYACNPRTARRIIASAIDRGLIARTGSLYGATGPRPRHPRFRSAANRQTPIGPEPLIPTHALVHAATPRYRRVDRHDLLTRLSGRDWRYAQLLTAIREWYGCSESAARQNLSLALRYNYIVAVPTGYRITELAEAQLRMYGRLTGIDGLRFARFCSGRPGLHLSNLPRPRSSDSEALGFDDSNGQTAHTHH